jgi:hypothetical protein
MLQRPGIQGRACSTLETNACWASSAGKFFVKPNSKDAESEEKDIAKYFVPTSTIRIFIPSEYRF